MSLKDSFKLSPIEFFEECSLEGGIPEAIMAGYNQNDLDGTDKELFIIVKRIVGMQKRLNIQYDNLANYAYQKYNISMDDL